MKSFLCPETHKTMLKIDCALCKNDAQITQGSFDDFFEFGNAKGEDLLKGFFPVYASSKEADKEARAFICGECAVQAGAEISCFISRGICDGHPKTP